MIKYPALVFFLCCLFGMSDAQNPTFPTPLSSRIANYDIDVSLDAETHQLDAYETLHWKNLSPDTIRELQFHLYLNAFKNTQSTFISERSLRRFGINFDPEKNTGWVEIQSMAIEGGETLTDSIEYYQPDDDNEHDQTVIRVPLSEPILPDSSASIKIHFLAQLPELVVRTGYSRDYHLVVQWFPKIGVYEEAGERYSTDGQWNCHQYHSSTEYYSDFGEYNVHITVPEEMVVGATGLLVEEKANGDGTKTCSYHAEDVIDFAWTAYPGFLEYNRKWKHVDIRLLTHPEHKCNMERYFHSITAAFEYLDEHVGKYPYPNLTIVDPPYHGLRSSGMEYPTFITSASLCGFPEGLRTLEVLTIHEFVHQYFMQMVASNEMEEAWMDEGMTNYLQGRIMDATYGEHSATIDLLGYQAGDTEYSRFRYASLPNPRIDSIYGYPWTFKHGGYHTLTYAKMGTVLNTLDRLVGREVMDEILQTYFERWKFKHPSGQDFIDVVNEVVKKRHGDKFGEDMDWFFKQTLYEAGVCDYAVVGVDRYPSWNDIGVYEENGEKQIVKRKGEPDGYVSTVTVHRLGEVQMPVEVLVKFASGKEEIVEWDGKAQAHIFEFEGDDRIVSAQVDPAYKLWLDINFNNNSITEEPAASAIKKYGMKLLFWLQTLMMWLASLV